MKTETANLNLSFEDNEIATPKFIEEHNRQVIESYKSQPTLIEEHANQEIAAAEGAYGHRQVFELIQNAADAIRGFPDGRIHLILTRTALYCANTGKPIAISGVRAILHSFLSRKQGGEIGRYGLGFKSALGVSDNPEFYSAGVSFCFDSEWSANLVQENTGYKGNTPKLRLAKVIENSVNHENDSLLNELLKWAVSVVKLPFRDAEHDWLKQDINNFPGEFLLFCPDVKELILEDRSQPLDSISIHRFSRTGENPVRVFVNDKPTEWLVFKTIVKPTERAKADGGYFAGRESVNLSWAVPAQGGFSDGQFWAFFPLEKEKMSLKGILNAAWKLNDDRQNILDGFFNDELLEISAKLALTNLPTLFDKNDPGKLLEVLPARLDERVGADLHLTKRFYELSLNCPTVPDCQGNLRLARELKIPPKNLPESAVNFWAECPYQPTGWAHPSTVITTTRAARLDQLMGTGQQRETVTSWLETLVGYDNIREAVTNFGIKEFEALKICSSQALKVAAAIYESKSASIETQQEVLQACILLTVDEKLVNLEKNTVFLPAEAGQIYSGISVVHPDLLKENVLLNIFTVLGVSEVDPTSELQSLLSSDSIKYFSDDYWERLWNIVAKIESNEETVGRSTPIIRQFCKKEAPQHVVHVKTISGHYQLLGKTLLPGAIVSGNDDNRTVIIDTDFHTPHEHVLTDLGAVQTPIEGGGSRKESWFIEYKQYAINTFMEAKSPTSARPGDYKLDFQENKFTGPIEPFISLNDEGRVRFTATLLNSKETSENWHFQHISSSSYPIVDVDSPILWSIKQYGRFRTSLGVRPFTETVGSALANWSKFFPVADLGSEIQTLLNLPQTPWEIKSSIIEQALKSVMEISSPFMIGAFYAFISDSQPAPEKIWSRIADKSDWHKPDKVVVVVAESINDSVISIIKEIGKPFLVLEDQNDARKLIKEWELRPVETSIVFETRAVLSGPETPLTDSFAGLGFMLDAEQSNIKLIPCSTLRREVFTDQGVKSENKIYIADKDQFYYLDSLNNQELLETIVEELNLELSEYEIEDILGSKESEEKQQVIRQIREVDSYAEKLLMCVGVDNLKKWLSNSLIEVAQSKNKTLTDQHIAELFLAVQGVESLIRLKDDLASLGFDVPIQWAGSHKARRFVKDLGFAPEYAGFESSDRKAVIDIEGPPVLPPLHTFQEKATQRIKSLLLSGGKNRRGLLSLPTGAGKTRVAVEAIIKTVRDDKFPGPILWVAQSDELCEQAVQSWDEVWRAVGLQSPLRLNRLWASNEADEWIEGPQVVVATMQKLQNIVEDADYDWLKNCSALIIDEAHLSTTPGYTAILEWVGATRQSARCPVLGLTATPFRGGEQETHRLAYRYDSNRLDEGILGDDPYKTLQTMGVLADVSHRLLEGANVRLDNRELIELEKTKRLSSTVIERLGNNKNRNDLIIDAVKSLPPDWSVLLFAVSVDNARTIAAMLAADGISSAAISSETTAGARRHYIEKFRNGKIRVLTNYGVLTTGFDAPAVRAIIVARPTFSPVIYQQMIGRGLRGPLNGGKQECLIVNVKDNFEQFGEKLAFTEFEYLWNKE
jgi:superfamily II DNA or RNA helicase